MMSVDEDEIEVKCMHTLGKLFWPSIRDDISMYSECDVICIVDEPVQVNRQSWKLKDEVWAAIEAILQI